MHERDHQDGRARRSKRRKRMWLAAISLIPLAIAGWFLWTVVFPRDSRTADERLAEIEAARAIPDSENAATIYNQLLADPNATSVLDDFPESPAGDVLGRVLREPWLGKDLPDLADWVKGHQYIIDRLLEATRLDQCRFRISIDPTDTSEANRMAPLRQWGFLLSIAANNDCAEGRIDAAMLKWRSLLRMESQLHQQPMQIDHLVASAVGRQAPESIARFIVAGDASEPRLQEIEAMELPTKDDWPELRKAIRLVEDLRSQRATEPFGPLDRLKYYVMSFRMRRAIKSTTGLNVNRPSLETKIANPYLHCTAAARGIRILIALKRYRNTTGHWPGSLDEVQSSLPEEILIDPLNQGPFVYKPNSDMFRLYSKGRHGIDEGGRTRQGENLEKLEDDLALWPPPVPEPQSPDDEETRRNQLEEIYGPDPG